MSSLSLTRFKTGSFNEIYLLKNTGQTNIYDIFASTSEVSNIYATDLSVLSNTLTNQQISIININNTLPSLISYDLWDNTLFPSTMNVIQQNYLLKQNFNNTLPSLITASTLSSTLSNYSTITATSHLEEVLLNELDTSLLIYTPLTTYNNTITTRLNAQQASINNINTSINNINNTLPSLVSFDLWDNNLFPQTMNVIQQNYLLKQDFNTTIGSYLSTSAFTAASVVTTSTLSNYNFNSITTNSLFMRGSIQGATALSLVSNTSDGVNLFCSGTTNIFNINNNSVNCNRDIFVSNSLPGGDVNLKIRNNASGLSSIFLQTQITTNTTRLYTDHNGQFRIVQNGMGTGFVGVVSCQANPNGVFQVMNNNVQNKMLVMYEQDASENVTSATNFFGLGINSNTFRYQVPALANNHRFFCGTTSSFFITNGAGTSGSDYRWKSEVQNITNGLDKVKQLQGKTFKFSNCVGRQMGLIAQDVQPVCPEIVYEDEEGYMFLAYDRLVALLIESVKELEQRVATLENNI